MAIATVADVVPLVGENRILSRNTACARSSSTQNVGLRAAPVRVAGLDGAKLEADDVAFKIGPRINAAGRLGSAQKAVVLLLARDANTALAPRRASSTG